MEPRSPRVRIAFFAAGAGVLVALGAAAGDRRAGHPARLDVDEPSSVVRPARVPRAYVRVARFADGPSPDPTWVSEPGR